jgi:hypothetical protein
MKKMIALSALAAATLGFASEADMQAQIDALNAKVKKMERMQKYAQKKLSAVNNQSANDNIKWDADFRTAYDNLDYKFADDALKSNGDPDPRAGEGFSNPSLFTSRLWLGMGAKPLENLFFYGQLAVYGYWGAENTGEADKGWRGSSRAHDATIRVREAYFVYQFGNDWTVPMSLSVGRRPATTGFLANHRQGDEKPGSPLAHITNMEVDAAMVKLDFAETLLPGSYLKIVYGRAHDPLKIDPTTPYIDDAIDDDKPVDFLVFPMSIYNDGQNNLMAQYTMVLNSKGRCIADETPKTAAGTTHLAALSYQLDGLNEDVEFLDGSTFFASAALTSTDPKSGFEMLGSTSPETGYSFWVGYLFPDMITDGGRFGLEYNWGSKYWTPMTWAEDTAVGSKIATRGSAYEAYWNIPIEGKNLSAQLRYTYLDYDYRANTTCYWDDPVDNPNLDSAQDIRAYIRYRF